ncbi:7924_t:CDS:2 [Paraglomus brasilianum]|uniref:7924_t:CDS:1 n=1 Tax=Paraglomus brasilianum TaxID=144538 RepID=A0A9N8VMM8_9GLOM|nr:7924_t:CDS:2 [Paraglomus brasilianum]
MKASHRLEVLSLYRGILKEASLFFDSDARIYLKERTKERFRAHKDEINVQRIKNQLADARKAFHQLQRANVYDVKSVMRILEFSYGRRGKKKHELLKPFISFPSAAPAPLISRVPRTAPPRIPPPLRALLASQVKSIDPILPIPKHKPLHPRREANLRWRHFSKITKQVLPPLPQDVVRELEEKAGKNLGNAEVEERMNDRRELGEKEKKYLDERRETEDVPRSPRDKVRNGEPYHVGRPHTPRSRLIRRFYQKLLAQVPVMHMSITDKDKKNSEESRSTNHHETHSLEVLINMPNVQYKFSKSAWADRRPLPLVSCEDREGLEDNELESKRKDKGKTKNERRESGPLKNIKKSYV